MIFGRRSVTELRRSGGMSQMAPSASRGPEIMKYGVSTSVRNKPNSAPMPSWPIRAKALAATSCSAAPQRALNVGVGGVVLPKGGNAVWPDNPRREVADRSRAALGDPHQIVHRIGADRVQRRHEQQHQHRVDQRADNPSPQPEP